jgi:hypothetical protein
MNTVGTTNDAQRTGSLNDSWTANAMRVYTTSALMTILVGCASAPSVPLPTATIFDDNPKRREAYLAGFSQGYRDGMANRRSLLQFRSGSDTPEAWDYGCLEGRSAALEAKIQQEPDIPKGARDGK